MVLFLSIWCVLATALAVSLFAGARADRAAREEIDSMREEKDTIIDFLHKTAECMGGGDIDKNKLYRLIVRATALTCGAMSACVYERTSDGKLVSRATEGLFPPQSRSVKGQGNMLRAKFLEEAIVGETIGEGDGVIGAVAARRGGIIVKNAEKDPRVMAHEDESLKVRSIIAVPVAFRDTLYGVLAVANPISGKPFTDTDFSLALSLGEQAGLALHNMDSLSAIIQKNKMEFDLRLASNVQKYLLPSSMPDTENLQFAVKYMPRQLIGGDFYDFYKLPDGRVGLAVGDVSGKGVSAAMVMAICRTKLQSLAVKNISPAGILKELNAEMFSVMRADMFITMTYAVVDADSSRITLARAGHEPALLYSEAAGGQAAKKIRGDGIALGMADSEIFDESISDIEISFSRGDVFVLYTDGLTEASDASGAEYTSGRLAEKIAQFGALSANAINESIVADVAGFTNNAEYADDLTLVCVKRI